MKQNVIRDEMEQQYRGNTHPKDAIGVLNVRTLFCCCFCSSRFGAVATTTDNCLKINSTPRSLTHNKTENINKICVN